MERGREPAPAVGNEEVHEGAARVVEPHHIGGVLGSDVEVIVWTEGEPNREVEIAPGIGEEIDECACGGVVAAHAKIVSEGPAGDIERAIRAERHRRRRIESAGADWTAWRHKQTR